jgi:hypothetical protein
MRDASSSKVRDRFADSCRTFRACTIMVILGSVAFFTRKRYIRVARLRLPHSERKAREGPFRVWIFSNLLDPSRNDMQCMYWWLTLQKVRLYAQAEYMALQRAVFERGGPGLAEVDVAALITIPYTEAFYPKY